jgi:CHAT domain-containing protein
VAASGGRALRGEADGRFEALPGTREELAVIHELYRTKFGKQGISVLESAGASEEALIREAQRHSSLHLATHGYFAAERFKSALARSTSEVKNASFELREVIFNVRSDQSLSGYHPGLLSGLALAGANHPDEKEDGILTAEEVGALNLTGTELVVLSACETGLGNTAGGEGLLGLQRAFQVAGAKTVVASLWSVPDQATKSLMVRFYENLWNKKMGKLEALREAQHWMLEHGAEQPEMKREMAARGLSVVERTEDGGQRTGRLPPYYWGAWVLSGDWR